ncbi:MAG: phage major capsid protein, partial [Candidatus Pacebacteria bacterium]|nr:phage major capsid protein [Candidatus Paceibacterota bacterium]
MKSIKELKEQRADIHDKLQLITSTVKREGRNMTDSEKTEFRNLTDEFDEFTVEIRKAEKAEQRLHTGPAPARQDAFGQPLDQDKMTGARALAGWAKLAGGGIATDEERQALTDSGMQIKADGSLIMRFAPETLGRTGVEARALGTTATNIGGSTVPTSVMETLIKARLAVGPILDYVRTFRTDTGETMEVPTWSGTSERGELTSEAGEVPEDTSTPFGTKT